MRIYLSKLQKAVQINECAQIICISMKGYNFFVLCCQKTRIQFLNCIFVCLYPNCKVLENGLFNLFYSEGNFSESRLILSLVNVISMHPLNVITFTRPIY